MALLKREEWQGFVRDVDWSYSYVDDEAVRRPAIRPAE